MPELVCANCDQTSVYELADPGAVPVYLCAVHLPDHLRLRVQTNQIKKFGVFKDEKKPDKEKEFPDE